MRTLPEFPSLDHLRRQAEDLLGVLRRSRPSATLADAQASLAAQYGYDSWAQLKAAAEQQRDAPAEIAGADLADALVERFASAAQRLRCAASSAPGPATCGSSRRPAAGSCSPSSSTT